MKIKKDDKVIVLTGKDKGKTGSVVKALPKENKIVVSGVNVLKVHKRARKSNEKGQIIDKTMPIHVSNVRKIEK
jgi:large subunit ribosomal protein L24